MMINTIRFDNKNFVELEEFQRVYKNLNTIIDENETVIKTLLSDKERIIIENGDLRLQISELQMIKENLLAGLEATLDEMNNKFEDKLALLNKEHQLLSKYDNNLIMELERKVFRLENELRKATTLSVNDNNTIEYTVVK